MLLTRMVSVDELSFDIKIQDRVKFVTFSNIRVSFPPISFKPLTNLIVINSIRIKWLRGMELDKSLIKGCWLDGWGQNGGHILSIYAYFHVHLIFKATYTNNEPAILNDYVSV